MKTPNDGKKCPWFQDSQDLRKDYCAADKYQTKIAGRGNTLWRWFVEGSA
jgi:hypothetical protein